jgi:peptidoglycan/xylan/chitin deacetylase (PgdA/CDA1 family)
MTHILPSGRRALAACALATLVAAGAAATFPGRPGFDARARGTPEALAQAARRADGAWDDGLAVLCYHDVRDDVRDDLHADPYAVGSDALVAQLEWLVGHGWRSVGVDDVLAARAGQQSLPPRAVLLCFDDAFASVRDRVLPLLELYDFRALVSVTGSWIEAGSDRGLGRDFASWDQLAELVASGRIEIASHAYAGHEFLRATPQGDREPALVARRITPAGTREDEAAWRARVREDLAANLDLVEQRLGVRPRVMTWPYGRTNGVLEEIAAELGCVLTFSLVAPAGPRAPRLPVARALPRHTLYANPDLETFVALVEQDAAPRPVRALALDLAEVLGEAERAGGGDAAFERALTRAAERVRSLGATRVWISAARLDARGFAEELYFANRHLPARDVLGRTLHVLREQAGVEVVARLPLTRYAFADPEHGGFEAVREVFEDLARAADLDGVLFDEDPAGGGGELATQWSELLVERLRSLRSDTLACERRIDAARVAAPGGTFVLERLARSADRLVLVGAGEPEADARALARVRRAGLAGRTTVLVPAERADGDGRDGLRTARALDGLLGRGFRDLGLALDQRLDALDATLVRPAFARDTYPYRRP